MTGIELIARERAEQIEKHGRTVEHDVIYNIRGQLIYAAQILLKEYVGRRYPTPPTDWDPKIWDKMIKKSFKERRILAAAMIAADIDREQQMCPFTLKYREPRKFDRDDYGLNNQHK